MQPRSRRDLINSLLALLLLGLAAAGLLALAARREAQLRTLVERGRSVEVTIAGLRRSGGEQLVEFVYEIDGARYRGSAKAPRPPPRAGEVVTGRYLPGDPGRVRVAPLDDATIASEAAPMRNLAWLILAAAGLILVLRHGLPRRFAGVAIGALFLSIVLAVNLDPGVGRVLAQAFGERPLGLPVRWVVCSAELVLLGPAFLILGPALLALAQEALKRGARGRLGLLRFIVRGAGLPPEIAAARRRALWSGLYLIAWMLAWIAFAEWRGI